MEELRIRAGTGLIVSPVEGSGDGQSGLSRGSAEEVENLLITLERFGGPVFGDLREQPMFDGIPLGSARGVMSHGDGAIESIAEWSLQCGLPGAAAATIAAARAGQNEELASAAIAERSIPFPAAGDGRSGEGGSIAGDTAQDGAAVGQQIVDPERDGYPDRVAAEVVSADRDQRTIPLGAGVLEVAEEFSLLGVDAEEGKARRRRKRVRHEEMSWNGWPRSGLEPEASFL